MQNEFVHFRGQVCELVFRDQAGNRAVHQEHQPTDSSEGSSKFVGKSARFFQTSGRVYQAKQQSAAGPRVLPKRWGECSNTIDGSDGSDGCAWSWKRWIAMDSDGSRLGDVLRIAIKDSVRDA